LVSELRKLSNLRRNEPDFRQVPDQLADVARSDAAGTIKNKLM